MGIENQYKRGTLLYDSHTCMMMSVNTTFMAFLWQQAIDAESQIINIAVFLGQDLWGLFLCGQHGLVALNRILDSIIREIYLVTIPKFSSNLSHPPMTGKSAMTYPGEVPNTKLKKTVATPI